MSSKKGIVIALGKYSSGVFEGIFSLFVWWEHLRGREVSNVLCLPPSDITESYKVSILLRTSLKASVTVTISL